jgi:hypothetical protein
LTIHTYITIRKNNRDEFLYSFLTMAYILTYPFGHAPHCYCAFAAMYNFT